MLTAQKDNSPLETEPIPQRLSTTRSFDRVVNSIEGLRGRVQGFTPEQVSEAEQKLRTMSLQLDELQRTLEALAEIKLRMSRLQKAVKQAEAESLQESRLATRVEPPPVQSIAQFGAMLKFRRVLKVLKEAKNGLTLSAAVNAEAEIRVRPKPVEIAPEQPNNEEESAADSITILRELSEVSASEDTTVIAHEALEQTETLSDPTAVEMDFEPHESFSNGPVDGILDDSTTALEQQEMAAEFEDTREEPPASHRAIFEEFKGTRDMELHFDIPETETAETTGQTNKSASEEVDFDQRLLDDLIKNYGEFTILPSSTSKDEPTRERKSEAVRPRVNTPTPVIPSPNLPSPRKDGELDQKLKKLIKDYGEYDLYSRQTPAKLKTGVIAAFVLLTLIFSGFYFFSSPKSGTPPSASTTSQSQSGLDKAPKETPPNDETRRSETLPSVSNVEVPKTVESGASHNAPNKLQ